MQAALKSDFVAVEDYLAGEQTSETKHEYAAGAVYAMAGGTTDHNQIAINSLLALRFHLKGKSCRVFISDVKVRMAVAEEDVFYYPDVMVGCDKRDTHQQYLRYPKILVEVASPSTERLDRREKRLAYQTIETLAEYVLVAQDRFEVTLFRRSHKWKPEVFNRQDHILPLRSIALDLPIADLYLGVTLAQK